MKLAPGHEWHIFHILLSMVGTVASWLLCSSLEGVVWVRALPKNTVLCSWARHLHLTVPHSTQEFEWVQANCWGNLTNCRGVTCDGLASRPGGVEILLAASCYRNWGQLWPDGHLACISHGSVIASWANIIFWICFPPQ